MHKVSAYVPARNSAATLVEVLRSLRAQTIPIDDLIVIDDASEDETSRIAREWGARVFRFNENVGRGAARAKAFEEVRHEYVLGVDATSSIPPDYSIKALKHFDSGVAGVFGRIFQVPATTAAGRWRARHLYRENATFRVERKRLLCTGASLLRRDMVAAAGGFNETMECGEDRDLGARLLEKGFDVIFDPELKYLSIAQASLLGTLERYWRWGRNEQSKISFIGYVKQIWYSARVMASQDICAHDPAAAMISLAWPHFALWMDIKCHRSVRRSQE